MGLEREKTVGRIHLFLDRHEWWLRWIYRIAVLGYLSELTQHLRHLYQ